MSSFKIYLSILFFMSTMIIYSSQDPMVVFSSGQKGLYHEDSLIEVVSNNFQGMEAAFNAKDYRLAAMLGVGASRYARIMALPQIDPVVVKSIDFIVAKSFMELQSPQHALTAFKNIHDKETKYGIISSIEMAESLACKKETLSPENLLYQKLSEHICCFEQHAADMRIKEYNKEYKDCTLDEIIKKVRLTRDSERLSVLMSAIKEHAENGNLRALCVMTAAYNTGQYGVDICQKTAVEYACRYVALLAENQASVPLEHFGIKHALSNSSVDNNQQALIALSYCDYIYAVKQNSVESGQKAVRELKKIKDISASLRGIIIDTCAIAHNINIVDSALFAQIENNVIKQLQQLEMQSNFTETIELFIAADGKFVIPLLQSLSHMPTACKKNINYILGLLCYYQKNPDYSVAQYYFELSEQNITDPLIQYICFICDQKVNSTSVTNRIASLITLIKNFNVLSKRQIRNHFVDKLLDHYLVENSISYIKELFNEQSYALTRDFFELLLQKQRTGALVIELLDQMNSDLSASKNQDTVASFNKFYYAVLYPLLLASNKAHFSPKTALMVAELLSISLSSSLISNNQYSAVLDAVKLITQEVEKKKAFVQAAKQQIARIYCVLGQECNDMLYCNKAIAYGENDALYYKALLLLQQSPTKKKENEALSLLKKHAKSDSSLCCKSLNKLGELYFDYATQGPLLIHNSCDNHQALYYLEEAVKKNDLQACGLLAILYTQGIKKSTVKGEIWLREPDDKKALRYFQQPTSLHLPCKTEILFSRGITYYNNSLFELALKDFEQIVLSSLSEHQQSAIMRYKMLAILQINAQKEKLLQIPDQELNERALDYLESALEKECNLGLIGKDIECIMKLPPEDIRKWSNYFLKNNKIGK